MAEESYIEKLFREKFESYAENPSEDTWKVVQRRLQFHDFFSFSFNKINIYYLVALVSALAGGILLFTGDDKPVPEPQTIEQPDNVGNAYTESREEVINGTGPESGLEQRKIIAKTTPAETTVHEAVQLTDVPEKQVKEELKEIKTEVAMQTGEEEKIKPSMPLIASFKMSQKESCGPALIKFQNLSQNAVNYTWNFGDGVISNQRDPVYLFERPGTYFVELTANDAYGNNAFAIDTIIVKTKPRAQFEFLVESNGLSNIMVYFYNYSRNADSYQWRFGDGNTSSHINPTHVYKNRDEYRVTLIASNNEGCSDTMVVGNLFPGNEYFIRFPSAFSPNPSSPGDGSFSVRDITNQVFFPVWSGVAEYNLQIFNRTGVLLFESNDIQIGWNGYYRNQMVKPDVYIWKASGKFLNGKSFVLTGDITVILRR